MEEAHRLGMRTTATMMFGSREKPEDIVEHLFGCARLQAKTGGFTAFIPWTYQPGNTELGGETASGVEYLKCWPCRASFSTTSPISRRAG